ncbi:MAG: hypothetical protein H7263_07550, partial [Candidatus Sericytochromatia bacterium]|nr:hypothetical protein [Candidatus Sericytochromatia bacterium]
MLTLKQGATVVSTTNVSGQSTTTQAITGLTASTAYTYTIQANSGTGLSAVSNSISISTSSAVVVNGGMVTTLAGGTSSGYGTGTAAQFSNPQGVAVDSLALGNNIYVADKNNHKIRKITSGGVVTTLAGSLTNISGSADNAIGTDASFNYPYGVAVDSSGNVYVADVVNNKIRKIANDANHTVTTIAGAGNGYADGNGTAAQFNYPQGLAVDSSGNVYVADTINHKIRKIANDATHTVSTITGTTGIGNGVNGDSSGYLDGNGTAAQFNNPQGVSVDSSGNVYVADTYNHKIRKIANDANNTV